MHLLEIKNLDIFSKDQQFVSNVSFDLKQSEILAIIGESGSGKSLIAKAITRLNNEEYFNYQGEIIFDKKDNILLFNEKKINRFRGRDIGIIFQDPFVSLNPLHNIYKQVAERLICNKLASKKTAYKKATEILAEVGIDDVIDKNTYPHQLSGGQKQRVMIALAVIAKPKILIADEATTALDNDAQTEIINLLKNLVKKYKIGLIFITHDLLLVKNIADTLLILEKGNIVEYDKAEEIFKKPKNQYSKKLLNAHKFNLSKNTDISKYPLIEIKNLDINYDIGGFFIKKKKNIIKNFSLKIYQGETLALTGNSGSGKTTISKVLLQLKQDYLGEIFFQNIDLKTLSKEKLRLLRKDMQIVFQDPYATLNPKMNIFAILLESLKAHKIKNEEKLIKNVLLEVGLNEKDLYKYPHQFSGGQRQRIAIARSLILSPKFIVLDEPTASLDVISQKKIIKLLIDLQKKYKISYLFISHSQELVDVISHRAVSL